MEVVRHKIFISAYACEPNLGSEIGVGWHWVLEMAKYFELWVLTRKSNQNSIEGWLKEHPIENKIHFIYYDLPPKLRFWKKGMRGVRTYYVLWQMLTNRLVKQVMQVNDITNFHLLTYGNALWPVSRYGQKQHFIWGPTGVGDTIPAEYSQHYAAKGRVIESIRRLVMATLPFNRGFYQRCSSANLVLCKTIATLNSIPKKYRSKAILFTDVAVDVIDTSSFPIRVKTINEPISYLAVGRLDAWRGFDLLIEAFALAIKKETNIKLEILGKGSDKQRLEFLIKKYHLENVIALTGQVSMQEYYRKMANCDVVVNPSLKEGAVTTAFDSMSFSKPLICIDTGGYTHYFKNTYAIVIPRTNRPEVIHQIAEAIVRLTTDKERKSMGALAHKQGQEFGWEQKGSQIYTAISNSVTQ
jgi:glycosyltransferase involved in cell wall biosynthesis